MGYENATDAVELVTYAAELLWPVNRVSIEPAPPESLACDCLRVRASRMLRACALLIGGGYATEAAVLVRSLWEDAVSAAFIAEKPGDRAQRWIDFGEKRRIHHLKRGIENPPYLSPEQTRELELEVAGKEASTSADWAGTSASSLAKGLASSSSPTSRTLSRDFALMYEELCDVAHGSPFAVDKLLSGDGDRAFVSVGPSDDEVAYAASLAVYAACQIAISVNVMGGDISLDDVNDLTGRLVSRHDAPR